MSIQHGRIERGNRSLLKTEPGSRLIELHLVAKIELPAVVESSALECELIWDGVTVPTEVTTFWDDDV